MTKPINFRPILFCALSLIVGIIFYWLSPTLKIWTILLPIILAIIIFAIFFFFANKDDVKTAFITVCACLCFSFIGIALFGLNVNYNKNKMVENGSYQISGVVESVSYKDGVYHVGLTDCTYNGSDGGDLFIYSVEQKVSLYDALKKSSRAR